MKKLLTLLLVLVSGVGFAAGTTTETSGKTLAVDKIFGTGMLLVDATQTGNTTLSTASSSTILFGTASVNVGGCYGVTTGIFTAPTTGRYQIEAVACYLAGATGYRMMSYAVVGTGARALYVKFEPGFAAANTYVGGVSEQILSAGETVLFSVEHTQGSNLNIYGGRANTRLVIRLLP